MSRFANNLRSVQIITTNSVTALQVRSKSKAPRGIFNWRLPNCDASVAGHSSPHCLGLALRIFSDQSRQVKINLEGGLCTFNV